LQAIRIEPYLHREIARAKHRDRAHTVEAGQDVLHVKIGIVGQEDRIARLVGRIQVHHHQDVRRTFLDPDADLLDRLWQARRCSRYTVLDLHLRDIEIGAEFERHRNREPAVRGRVRGNIKHPLDAVDLLLNRGRDGVGDDFGAGAGILPGDVDHRRRDFRILRNRQPQKGDAAENDKDG